MQMKIKNLQFTALKTNTLLTNLNNSYLSVIGSKHLFLQQITMAKKTADGTSSIDSSEL